MKLSETCIQRPVFSVVISLVLILLGVLGFKQLELRAQPKVFRPKLVVMVQAPGSSAQFVEKNIVIPLENRLQATSYLSFTQSQSVEGYAEIQLYFQQVTPEKFLTAQSQVMEEVDQTQLPDNVKKPEIRRAGNHGNQIMFFSISSTNMGQHRLVNYVYNNVVRRLQQVPGVGTVQQFSTRDALRINLLPSKMAQLGVTVGEVRNALSTNDISVQSGEIVNATQEIPINLNSRLESVAQFQKMIIARAANRVIRLDDIAKVEIDNTSYAGAYTFYNGKQGAGVSIVASDDANPIALGKQLRSIMKKMELSMPPGMKVHMLWDQASLIEHSVQEVFMTILEAVLLVALITLLFLGRWRFAMIPIITIPVCIIATFAVMWLLGFSINLMTLLALVLGVGLVVDDAIVVLENCHRHVENGISAMQAAAKSMKEITFPVIGMTISIVAVYIPTAFMSGKTAVYFQQFAFTLAGAVLISGVIALTLTPMMCSRLMSKVSGGGYDAVLERVFAGLRRHYRTILQWVLKNMWLPALIFIMLLAFGVGVFKGLPSTLLPKEYGGYIFVGVQPPDSSSVAYTESVAKNVVVKILKMPEVSGIMSFGGGTGNRGNFGGNFIRLKPKYQDKSDNITIAGEIANKFKNIPEAKVFAVPINVSGSNHEGNPGQLSFYVTGFVNYPQLASVVKDYVAALKKTNLFQEVDNQLRYSSQQYDININRLEATELDIPIANISAAVSTFLGGYTIEDGYQFNGVNYPVIMQLPASQMTDLNALSDIYLTNASGAKIPLSRVLTVKPTIGLPQRIHINDMRSGEINVTPKANFSTGQIINAMQQVAKSVFPPGISLSYTQEVRDLLKGNNTMTLIFGMGLVFIYLILAALFESFIDPLVILLTVPLCIIGALLVLKWVGGSLNIYTGIGLVTLIGLVSKHGVLITQFANMNREAGQSIYEAIVDAATMRIRPILMTTATMMIGAVPLLLATGIGSNSRLQLGCVIIAGLFVGTFFSLFVVPVAYLLLAKFKKIKGGEHAIDSTNSIGS